MGKNSNLYNLLIEFVKIANWCGEKKKRKSTRMAMTAIFFVDDYHIFLQSFNYIRANRLLQVPHEYFLMGI